MGLSNGILLYPFTKIAANGNGDLQQALGISSLNHAALFSAPNLNIWAKYKPFQDAGLPFVTPDAAGWAVRNARAAAKDYGFFNDTIATLPNTYNFDASQAGCFQNFYLNSLADQSGKPLNGWQYYKPTTYKRALDFHGYRINAGHPVAIAPPASIGSFSRQYPNITFNFALTALIHDNVEIFTGDDGQLTLYDFPDLQGKYFGALLQDANDPSKQIFATGSQLNSNTTSLSVSFTPYYFPSGWTGTFNAYFFFADRQISQGTSSNSAVCYPIPGCEISVVNIVTTMYAATIVATKARFGYSISADYTITNLDSAAHTFATNEMRCRYASVTSWNAIEDGAESAQNKDLGSITVGAGATVSGTVNFRNIDPTLFASCKIWGKFGSSEIDPFGVSPKAQPIPEPTS